MKTEITWTIDPETLPAQSLAEIQACITFATENTNLEEITPPDSTCYLKIDYVDLALPTEDPITNFHYRNPHYPTTNNQATIAVWISFSHEPETSPSPIFVTDDGPIVYI